MPEFSIIIPVYNSEKTLYRCLDSLCAQTFADFEVHMVENGSVDLSDKICKEYADKDSRFLLHSCEKNCGPSGARNIGLDSATGKYIAFVDSDDFVQPDYLELLHDGFENSDIVFLGFNKLTDNGKIISTNIPEITAESNYYEKIIQLYFQDMYGYTWVKAFRADVIGQHRFSEQLTLMEDELFTCEALATPHRISVVQKPIYNYITGNTGSLMGRTHQDYYRKVDIVYQAWDSLLANYDKKEEILVKMADSHVNKCMYYCYERDVDIKEFCNQLADSAFFAASCIHNTFAKCVKNRNYKKLSTMKTSYQLKNRIARLLKR